MPGHLAFLGRRAYQVDGRFPLGVRSTHAPGGQACAYSAVFACGGAGTTGAHHEEQEEALMSTELMRTDGQKGKIGYAIAWLLGIPLPILIIIYLITHH
jgi:hypothetical protein